MAITCSVKAPEWSSRLEKFYMNTKPTEKQCDHLCDSDCDMIVHVCMSVCISDCAIMRTEHTGDHSQKVN